MKAQGANSLLWMAAMWFAATATTTNYLVEATPTRKRFLRGLKKKNKIQAGTARASSSDNLLNEDHAYFEGLVQEEMSMPGPDGVGTPTNPPTNRPTPSRPVVTKAPASVPVVPPEPVTVGPIEAEPETMPPMEPATPEPVDEPATIEPTEEPMPETETLAPTEAPVVAPVASPTLEPTTKDDKDDKGDKGSGKEDDEDDKQKGSGKDDVDTDSGSGAASATLGPDGTGGDGATAGPVDDSDMAGAGGDGATLGPDAGAGGDGATIGPVDGDGMDGAGDKDDKGDKGDKEKDADKYADDEDQAGANDLATAGPMDDVDMDVATAGPVDGEGDKDKDDKYDNDKQKDKDKDDKYTDDVDMEGVSDPATEGPVDDIDTELPTAGPAMDGEGDKDDKYDNDKGDKQKDKDDKYPDEADDADMAGANDLATAGPMDDLDMDSATSGPAMDGEGDKDDKGDKQKDDDKDDKYIDEVDDTDMAGVSDLTATAGPMDDMDMDSATAGPVDGEGAKDDKYNNDKDDKQKEDDKYADAIDDSDMAVANDLSTEGPMDNSDMDMGGVGGVSDLATAGPADGEGDKDDKYNNDKGDKEYTEEAADVDDEDRLLILPTEERAEGITNGPGSSMYVSQILSGRVLEVDVLTGETTEVVGEQSGGQQAWGLEYYVMDDVGYLVVAGGGPSYGTGSAEAYMYNAETGELIVTCQPISSNVTGLGAFINDVTIVDDVAFLTDSFNDHLMVMSLPEARNGNCEISEIPLPNSFVPSSSADWGANGIVSYDDGLLVSNEIEGTVFFLPELEDVLDGDIPIFYEIIRDALGADGLTVVEDRLYVTQNTENKIGVYELSFDKKLLKATNMGNLTASDFDTPATSAVYDGYVYSTNARFVTMPDLTDTEAEFGLVVVEDDL